MYDDESYESAYCPDCEQEVIYEKCHACMGKGGFDGDDLMEEDPLWYSPNDYERCEECNGTGTIAICACDDKS